MAMLFCWTFSTLAVSIRAGDGAKIRTLSSELIMLQQYLRVRWRWLRGVVAAVTGRRWQQVDMEAQTKLQVILFEESTLSLNYLVLVLSSCAIATFGLIADSAAVIIGAMIVAPLMLPIRGVALGALKGNLKLFRAGAFSIVIGTGLGIGLSYTVGTLVGLSSLGSEIMARTQPNLLDLGIAIAAGSVGAFAKLRPKISDSVVGVAIAVALMPPVCVIGLGLAHGDPAISNGATLLYLTNLLGIALACMVTFLVMGYAPRNSRVLLGSVGLTALLAVPLGNNLVRLLNQARLETTLRTSLTQGTITFQRVNLVDSEFNWFRTPPEATLVVTAEELITPRQVRLLEEYAEAATGQRFALIFQVGRLREVRRQQAPSLTLATQAQLTATTRILLGLPLRFTVQALPSFMNMSTTVTSTSVSNLDGVQLLESRLVFTPDATLASFTPAAWPEATFIQTGSLAWWQQLILTLPPQLTTLELAITPNTPPPWPLLAPTRDMTYRP